MERIFGYFGEVILLDTVKEDAEWMVREQACQRHWQRLRGGGGAPQRGHSASLEPLAQRNDTLSGDNKLAVIPVPTNVVVSEPGRGKHSSVSGR